VSTFEDIRTRLDRLRHADRRRKLFGASEHRYELGPPVSANALRAFEERHAIQLPEDYRAFLTHLGNGGAGPFYGLFPLGLFDGSGAGPLEPWDGMEGIVGDLPAPFPLREAWNLTEARFEPPDAFASPEEEERWYEALDAECWRSDLVNGAFPICHHGCALRTYLIVSGPERGNVWFDRRAESGGIEPHDDTQGRHLDFLAWYGRWLDEGLRALGA
jgi:hypothetical protein